MNPMQSQQIPRKRRPEMNDMIKALQTKKDLVRANAEDFCRSLDRVIELYRADDERGSPANASADVTRPPAPLRKEPAPGPHPKSKRKPIGVRHPHARTPGCIAEAVRSVVQTSPEPFTIETIVPMVLAHPNAKGKSPRAVKNAARKVFFDLRIKGEIERFGSPFQTKSYCRNGPFAIDALRSQIRAQVQPVIDARNDALRGSL